MQKNISYKKCLKIISTSIINAQFENKVKNDENVENYLLV